MTNFGCPIAYEATDAARAGKNFLDIFAVRDGCSARPRKGRPAARYVINSMFGVVQYSLMLRSAPREHREMIEKWIRFSQEHRQTFLHGTFTPRHPELQYPVIEAESDEERIIGLYDDGRVLEIPDAKKTIVMNASGKDTFVIRRNGRLSEVACKSGDWIELR